MPVPMPSSPCQSCGACCASFRVTFHRSELDGEGGLVPESLADEETASLCRMRGTDYSPPRCIALVGEIGVSVTCGIYRERPSPCREFGERVEMGVYDDACLRARSRHGLPPPGNGREARGPASGSAAAYGSN